MRVRDLMTTDVVTVAPDTPVNRVARLMHERDISGVPVVDAGGALVGIITELDMIERTGRIEMPVFLQIFDASIPLAWPRHVRDRVRHILGTRAGDVMTTGVHHVSPETPVEDLVHTMLKRRVNPVPVVESGRLVGIVSRSDLIARMARDVDAGAPGASA